MANRGDRTVRVRDPARVLELHVDKYRRSRTGSVVAVHHVGMGKWMSMRDYYLLQKAHDAEPLLREAVKGGYLLNAVIYGFMPEVSVAGFTVPIPAGPALLGAALLDVFTQMNVQPMNPLLLAKALFKVAGPFGALLQAFESTVGTVEALESLKSALPSWTGGDPCAPTLFERLIEETTPGGAMLKAERDRRCAEKQGLTR